MCSALYKVTKMNSQPSLEGITTSKIGGMQDALDDPREVVSLGGKSCLCF